MERKFKVGDTVYINDFTFKNTKGVMLHVDMVANVMPYKIEYERKGSKRIGWFDESDLSLKPFISPAEISKIIIDHDVRLESLLLVKGLPKSVEAYIHEFLLNKEFKEVVEQVKLRTCTEEPK